MRRRRLRRLVVAFLVNELGDGIAVVVLPLLVYQATGSGLLTGTVFAAVRASGVVGRPIGGLLADRLDRVRVLRATFALRGGLLMLGLVSRADSVLVACLLLTAFVGTVDNPSGEAVIREDAAEDLQEVSTIRKVSRALSGIVGLALGGLIVGTAGAEVAVAVDVVTYLVALALLPHSRHSRHSRPGHDGPTGRPLVGRAAALRRGVAASVADSREGIRHLRGHRDLRVVATTSMVSAGVVTALLTVAIVWLDVLADAPAGAYGIALAGHSAGAILGLIVAGTIAWRIAIPRLAARTMAVAGMVCALGVVGSDWRLLAVSWLCWGVTWGPMHVWGDVRLVARTPARLLGRTYGGTGMLVAVGQVIGGLAGGLLADVVDPRLVIIGLSGVLLAASGHLLVTRQYGPAEGRLSPLDGQP